MYEHEEKWAGKKEISHTDFRNRTKHSYRKYEIYPIVGAALDDSILKTAENIWN